MSNKRSKTGYLPLKVIMMPIDGLRPYERNPRKNDSAVDKMKAAIEEYGFRIPIVAKSDGSVVDGHLRLKAAVAMGMTEVPVALADELTDAQIKAFRILANQSANWAEWDLGLLKIELEDLQAMDVNLDVIGFSDGFIGSLLEQADEMGYTRREGQGALAEKFGISPFSVLSARDGWWQDRKKAWIDLGIDSVLGRAGGNLLKFSKATHIVLHRPKDGLDVGSVF